MMAAITRAKMERAPRGWTLTEELVMESVSLPELLPEFGLELGCLVAAGLELGWPEEAGLLVAAGLELGF